MPTLGELLLEDDRAAMEQLRKEQAAYKALPKSERDKIEKDHSDRVARDVEPHRVDLTDDDEEE